MDWNLGKEIIILIIFSIILPTWDTFSDLCFLIKLYSAKHFYYSLSMGLPVLLNYIMGWVTWGRLESRKTMSWMAPLLNLYPQWKAATVITTMWRDKAKGLVKKKKMLREMSENEAFFEAVWTTFILTFLWRKAWNLKMSFDKYGFEAWNNNIHNEYTLITGGGSLLFYATYVSSVITASLGLAKPLLVGPCRVLQGDSMFTGRFLLLFCAMGSTLVAKGLVVAMAGEFGNSRYYLLLPLTIPATFLPGLAISLSAICKHLKTVISHPSILLLPMITYFTFVPTYSSCCCCYCSSCCQGDLGVTIRDGSMIRGGSVLKMSVPCSILNMAVSGLVTSFTSVAMVPVFSGTTELIGVNLFIVFPILILSLILTAIFFLVTSRCCCCPLEYGVYCPEDPSTAYLVTRVEGKEEVVTRELLMENREEQELQRVAT